MSQVSQRWRETAPDATEWVTEVVYSNDGGRNWSTPADVYVGSKVVADSTQQVRWQCNLELAGWDVGLGGFQPYTSRIRVRQARRYAPASLEWIGLGVYRVDRVVRSLSNPRRFSVEGRSFEAYVQDEKFTVPRNLPGSPAGVRLDNLIHGVLPGVTIYWHPGVNRNIYLPATTAEGSRWDLIDGGADSPSIARALGARVYVDRNGIWHVAKVPAIHDTPVWEAKAGDRGVLLGSTEALSADDVFNMVIAVGESVDGTVTRPGIAQDNDPYSLTYVRRTPDQGGFGVRVRKPDYVSDLIRDDGQAIVAAQGLLEPSLGLKRQIDFDQLYDPSKEPDEVGALDAPSGELAAILDRVNYDLAGTRMSSTTRTTRTNLGTVVTVQGV